MGSTEPTKTICVKGVSESATYERYDFDTDKIIEISGKALKDGITVELPQEGSALYRLTEK